jgi:hypothetical protein
MNTTARQSIRVMLSGLEDQDATPVFTLRSTTGNKQVYEASWEDGVYEFGYLRGTIKLPAGLHDGEYEYRLAQGSQTMSSGVAQVGDYQAVPVQKSETTITFRQYGRKD